MKVYIVIDNEYSSLIGCFKDKDDAIRSCEINFMEEHDPGDFDEEVTEFEFDDMTKIELTSCDKNFKNTFSIYKIAVQ